jgi:predicted DNA-binding transcriptional regulator AlpA
MRFLSMKQVLAMLGVSRATIDRWESAGHFPKRKVLGIAQPIRYSKGAHAGAYKSHNCRIGYLEDEVLEWMKSRT